MTEYERSRTMPAQPEHVFDQAADLDRLDSWLPEAVHVEPEDLPAVTVHEDRTDEDTSALLRSRPEQMRLEWGTREDGSYAGWLQVAGIDSGASEVTLHLSFLDERHDPGEARPSTAVWPVWRSRSGCASTTRRADRAGAAAGQLPSTAGNSTPVPP